MRGQKEQDLKNNEPGSTENGERGTSWKLRSIKEANKARIPVVTDQVAKRVVKGGRKLAADGQLAGTPSVLFDAVAVVVSSAGCAELLGENAATDFVANAFVHLKAIGFTPEAQPLLDRAGVMPDPGVVALDETAAQAFLPPARTRQWAREPGVRQLA